MKRKVSALLYGTIVSVLVAFPAIRQPVFALPIGRIKNVKPVVEVKSDKGRNWVSARERHALAFGDFIRTGASGKADLLFNNGTLLALRGNTRIHIEAPPSANKPLVVRVFGALSEVFVRAKGNTEIRTAAGTAAVRGTEYLVSLPSEDSAVVTVVEGSVNFFNPQGSVTVNANQQSTARVGEAPTPPTAVDVSGLMEWTAEIVGLPVEFETPATLSPGVESALRSISAGKLPEARAAIEGLPDDATALAVLGLIELHSGNNAQAAQALQNALTRDPQLYQAQALLALTQLTRNQIAEAERSARRAVELQPNSAQTQGTLAMVLFFAKKNSEATRAAQRAVKLNPLSPFALLTQGRVFLAQQKTDAALSAFQQAAALAPGLAIMHTELGAVYLRLDRPQSAEAAYRAALKLNPDSADAHTGLGVALQREGREQDALAEHQQALQLDPANTTAHANLAALYIEQGRFDDAQKELEQGVKDQPERGILYARLAELSLYKQNLFAAQEYARRAVKLLPNSAIAHYQLGRVYLEQERLLQAEQEFRLAVTLDPQYAEARYALGITQEKTGQGLLASFTSLLGPATVGTPASSASLQNLQSPGAEQRIQAAVQDPTVVRVATRSYGDTQFDGVLGGQATRDFDLSHVAERGDRRGVWGVTAEEQKTDGPRFDADSKLERASITFGQKRSDNPSGLFVLGEVEHQDNGSNIFLTPLPFGSLPRDRIMLPRIVAGYNLQQDAQSRTRFLFQQSSDEDVTNDPVFPTFRQKFDIHSIDGEVRHDRQIGDRHLLIAGLALGTRQRDIDSFLPAFLPFFPTFQLNSRVDVHTWQAYLRDEMKVRRRLSVTAEMKLFNQRYADHIHSIVTSPPPLPSPPPSDTFHNGDTTLGIPNLIANYQANAHSILRFRARRLVAVIQDFQLLAPTDVFIFSVEDLPQPTAIQPSLPWGKSFELEYDYSFHNSSFLGLGMFQQDLQNASPPVGSPDTPFTTARLRGARVSYEGLLSRDLAIFARADLTNARGSTVNLLGTPISDTFLSQVPHVAGALGLQYLNPRGYFAQSILLYQGSRIQSVAAPPPVTLGGFGVLNLSVGRRNGLRTSLYVECNNVFDKTYDVFNVLQPGRQWRLGATKRF